VLAVAVTITRVVADGGLERRGDTRFDGLTELLRERLGALAVAIPQGEPGERHLRDHGSSGEPASAPAPTSRASCGVLGRQVLERQGDRRGRAESVR